METGPQFVISKNAAMIMEDIVGQMGQASLELQIAGSELVCYLTGTCKSSVCIGLLGRVERLVRNG